MLDVSNMQMVWWGMIIDALTARHLGVKRIALKTDGRTSNGTQYRLRLSQSSFRTRYV